MTGPHWATGFRTIYPTVPSPRPHDTSQHSESPRFGKPVYGQSGKKRCGARFCEGPVGPGAAIEPIALGPSRKNEPEALFSGRLRPNAPERAVASSSPQVSAMFAVYESLRIGPS